MAILRLGSDPGLPWGQVAWGQELFGLPVTRLDELGEAARDVQDKLRLWTALRDWKVLTAEWRMMRLQAIDPAQAPPVGMR